MGAAVKDGARESGASAGSRSVRTLLVVSEVVIALLLKSFGRLQEASQGCARVVDGQIAGEPGTEPKPQFHQVSPCYFETMGIPLLSGRAFIDRDDEDAPGVAILNQSAVRCLFQTEDPIGRRIVRVADGIGPLGRNLLDGREVEVVGVVADAKNTSLTTDVEPAMFLPQWQFAYRSMHLVVRGEGPLLGLVGAILGAVRELDAAMPLADIKTLDQHLGAQLAQPRCSMVLPVDLRRARQCRPLRRDGVLGVAAATRVRRPAGARRSVWPNPRSRHPAGHGAGGVSRPACLGRS